MCNLMTPPRGSPLRAPRSWGLHHRLLHEVASRLKTRNIIFRFGSFSGSLLILKTVRAELYLNLTGLPVGIDDTSHRGYRLNRLQRVAGRTDCRAESGQSKGAFANGTKWPMIEVTVGREHDFTVCFRRNLHRRLIVNSLDRTAETARRERRQFALWSTLLCVLVGIAYWPVQSFDFVNWDDTWYVLRNPYLGSWELSNLKAIATDVINRNYAPLTIFAYLVEHTFFGLEPAGYHIFNVFLHAVNSVLVFVLVSQVSRNRAAGWMTAAMFAVHPVQIESVAWVSSMKGLLCGTFILAHLICRLRPERTPRQDVWGFVFFLLALFSKALTIVVPAIVLLYDMLICKRKFKEALAGQFATGMLSVWLLVTTMSAQGTTLGGIRSHLILSKLEILGVDSIILWRYVGMLLWPSGLSVLYNPPVSGIAGQVIVATLAWGVFGAVVWKLRRVTPLLVLAAASWLILLLPVLNLTPLTTLMNDRYLYMPAIPFFAAVSCGLCFLWRELLASGPAVKQQTTWLRGCRLQHARATVPIAAVIALLIATRQHLPVWENDRALWEHTMTRVPELPIVRIQYAMMLHQAGEDRSAISVLEETLARYKPDAIDRERITAKISAWHREDADAGGTREWIVRESLLRPEPDQPAR